MERGAIEAAIEAFAQTLASEAHHPLAHRHLALCVNAPWPRLSRIAARLLQFEAVAAPAGTRLR